MKTSLPTLDGRYELSNELGRGSTGTVWEAWDRVASEVVAVKVLEPRLLILPRAKKRFLREVETARTLHHEHLVEVRAHGETEDGGAYLVMERLVGTTLASRLRETGPLDQRRAIKIVAQVLDAVLAAHGSNVVHRDLKPSNVMLITRDGDLDFVKVCDFGLAKPIEPDSFDSPEAGGLTLDLASRTTEEGIICGTPEYMAPEQARGEPIDGRADLYAIAVMLFQAVVGQLPFSGRSALAVVSLHLTATPPRPSELRPDLAIFPALENLILRGLAKDRAHRPSSARVFRDDLLQVGRDYARWAEKNAARSSSTAQVESATLTLSPERAAPARRGRTLAVLVAGVVAGCVLSAAWWTNRASSTGMAARALPAVVEEVAKVPSAPLVVTETSRPEAVSAAALDTANVVDEPAKPARPAAKPKSTTVPGKPLLEQANDALANGRVAEACALGEKALHEPSASPLVHKFLGKCFMRLGEREKGISHYRRYLALAPSSPDAVFVEEMIR